MRTSVIVSTYTKQRFNDIKKCIDSLLQQTLIPDEIILVLDPDPDLVSFYRKKLKSYPIKIVESFKRGLSPARNTGIHYAKGEIVVFIDDDAWAHPEWLKNLVRNFKDKNVVGVGGKIVPSFEGKRPKWLTDDLLWIVGCTFPPVFSEKKEIRNPIGANMAFRREVFEKIGLFREEVGRIGKILLGAEETELSMRIKKLYPNWKIIYDPDAVVYHRVPKTRATVKYTLRRAFYEGISKAILSKQYPIKGEYSYLLHLLRSILEDLAAAKLENVIVKVSIMSLVGFGYFYKILTSV